MVANPLATKGLVLKLLEGLCFFFSNTGQPHFIMLSLGSIETDHVISELCYNEVINNRHIAN